AMSRCAQESKTAVFYQGVTARYGRRRRRARRLPLRERMRTDHRQPPRARTSRRVRLLLVEDELSTVFAMREFFAQAGYEVDCASGLNESILLLDRQQYDAVITDLHLSVHRNGEGMRVAWQARKRNPNACIVMLTGFGNECTEEEARRCGVDMY